MGVYLLLGMPYCSSFFSFCFVVKKKFWKWAILFYFILFHFISQNWELQTITTKHTSDCFTFFPRVFVNRSLAMEKIKCFGFDMDYTLAGKLFPTSFDDYA